MGGIILTGPKHCGKTCAGKALASLCSAGRQTFCKFVDLDEEIMRRTGKSPRQLYSESPAVFQKAEAEALAWVITEDASQPADAQLFSIERVISTGGGIADNAEAVNMFARCKNSGDVIVYLNISAAAAWQRIAADGELPPFLKTETPQETHRDLHERRAAAYLQLADIVVEAEGKTPQEIAEEIVSCACRKTR